MAQEIPSLFTKYQLTEEEVTAAIQFTAVQRMYIQNLVAEAAEEKVRLTFEPSNMQREAELQGVILTLTNLLEQHSNQVATLTDSN